MVLYSPLAKQCHVSDSCTDSPVTVLATSTTECCQKGGKSFNDGFMCSPACGEIGEFISTTNAQDYKTGVFHFLSCMLYEITRCITIPLSII